jgi:hypothetical protein
VARRSVQDTTTGAIAAAVGVEAAMIGTAGKTFAQKRGEPHPGFRGFRRVTR